MWIFTRYGFFSAVTSRPIPGLPQTDELMIRARVKKHLENLIARFPTNLGGKEIHHSDNTDYPYRIYASRSVWSLVMETLGREIDYSNFKGEVADSGLTEPDYEHALHDVWAVMAGLQHRPT